MWYVRMCDPWLASSRCATWLNIYMSWICTVLLYQTYFHTHLHAHIYRYTYTYFVYMSAHMIWAYWWIVVITNAVSVHSPTNRNFFLSRNFDECSAHVCVCAKKRAQANRPRRRQREAKTRRGREETPEGEKVGREQIQKNLCVSYSGTWFCGATRLSRITPFKVQELLIFFNFQ